MNLTETCAKLCEENQNKDLLATILMPQKLSDLRNRLPRAKYSKNRLHRMNSEPARLPSVHSSRSRMGSAASSRKKWDLEKVTDKFVPRSVINSKKQQEDYHLIKETRDNRYSQPADSNRGGCKR